MRVFKNIDDYRRWHNTIDIGTSIGFVPTMGALHQGHTSLIKQSVKDNDVTVVSIFVNPIQFDSSKDLETYPQNFEKDFEICEAQGVESLFIPKPEEMYPAGHSTYCNVDNLDLHLCGNTRPGHFRGVCTVVLKLFNIVEANKAYFGQKDIQQAGILQKMIEDLNVNITIKTMPTIREPSGLALSSRNLKLSADQRIRASAIYSGLCQAEIAYKNGIANAGKLLEITKTQILSSNPKKIEYISMVDSHTLQPVETVKSSSILAVAVYWGDVRLIDNILLIA